MEVDWNALLSEAVTQLLKIFIPVLTVLVFKWLVQIWTKLREKNPKLAELIAYAAQLGYAAAEEYFREDPEAVGDEKMAFAMDHADHYLKSVGVNLDGEVIRDAITQFGVNNSRFSWAKMDFQKLFEQMKTEEPEGGLNPEKDNLTEADDEPGIADHLCVGPDRNSDHVDRDESGQQSAGPDQEDAADEG